MNFSEDFNERRNLASTKHFVHGCGDDFLSSFIGATLSVCDDSAFLGFLPRVKSESSKFSLLPHQIDSVCFLASRDFGILADDMGLGKTRATIVSSIISNRFPAVVICPTNLRSVWVDEISKVDSGLTVCSPNNQSEISVCDFLIIPFSRLKNFIDYPFHEFVALYIDEAHGFKNEARYYGKRQAEMVSHISNGKKFSAHRTQIIFSIADRFKSVYCLTGTPIASRPRELFNLLSLTRHSLGKNFIHYAFRYCEARRTPYGLDASGKSNLFELREKLANHVLRRNKKDVLTLPKKLISKVCIPKTTDFNRDYYTAWKKYLSSLNVGKEKRRNIIAARHLVELNLLRQVCSRNKSDWVVNHVCESNSSSVIFTTYSETVKDLVEKFSLANIEVFSFDGSKSEKAKSKTVKDFTNSKKRSVFVCNIEAAKTGLTLTKASAAYFIDYPWTPSDFIQASDRIYRIGQNLPVTIYMPYFQGSIDEFMIDVLNHKVDIIEKVFSGSSFDAIDENKDIQAEIEKALHAYASSVQETLSLL